MDRRRSAVLMFSKRSRKEITVEEVGKPILRLQGGHSSVKSEKPGNFVSSGKVKESQEI